MRFFACAALLGCCRLSGILVEPQPQPQVTDLSQGIIQKSAILALRMVETASMVGRAQMANPRTGRIPPDCIIVHWSHEGYMPSSIATYRLYWHVTYMILGCIGTYSRVKWSSTRVDPRRALSSWMPAMNSGESMPYLWIIYISCELRYTRVFSSTPSSREKNLPQPWTNSASALIRWHSSVDDFCWPQQVWPSRRSQASHGYMEAKIEIKIGGYRVRLLSFAEYQHSRSVLLPTQTRLQRSESFAETPEWVTYRLRFFTSFRGRRGSCRFQDSPMESFASSVRTTRSIFRRGANGDELAAGTQDAVCVVCSARRGSHSHPRVRDPYRQIFFENWVCCPESLRHLCDMGCDDICTLYRYVCAVFDLFSSLSWCIFGVS